MKALLFSIFVIVIITTAWTSTKEEESIETLEKVREIKHTADQCGNLVLQNSQFIEHISKKIIVSCTLSCTPSCRSAVTDLSNKLECCLNTLQDLPQVTNAYNLCFSPPSPCNSGSGVLASFSAVTLASVILMLN